MTDIDAIEARDLRLMRRLHTKGQIDGQDACTFCDHLWPCDAARLLDALRAAEAREKALREALDYIAHELGVPGPGYPMPVANAAKRARAALAEPTEAERLPDGCRCGADNHTAPCPVHP